MAQIINIAGAQAIDDPEYRYKMPRIIGKVEGRGNGIKTAIPNMVDVASSLHRPPGEVTKFFGCELGAQTTYNDDTERSIVNGAHETRVLQDKLSVYIEKFVLCPACKLPETSYKIKHEIIYHNCLACGAREPCDMQVRSRRPVVYRRLHAIAATRVHQTRSWVVSLSNLRPFGPHMLRAAQAHDVHPQAAQDREKS